MGLYDRDYTRDDEEWSPGGFGQRGGYAQSATVILIVINAAVWLLDQLLAVNGEHKLMSALAIDSRDIGNPLNWYQFVTAAFAHDTASPFHLVFNMIGLFVFGRSVEERLGKFEFLRFYLVAGILGNLVFAVPRYFGLWAPGTCLGASGAVTAILVLFICYYPNVTLLMFMVIPVKAWVAALFIIGSDMLGALRMSDQEMRVAHDVHLAGAAFGGAYWYFHWNLTRIMPIGWVAAIQQWLTRPRLKVHKPEETYDDLDAEADRILDKINREGEASLTAKEKRVLEEYSRRMRQKLR